MKDFSKLTTKKLNALLKTASGDERTAIEAELSSRVEAEVANTPVTDTDVTTDVADAAEAPVSKSEPKAVDPEAEAARVALIEELKNTVVGHRCEVLPAGEIEWVAGTISGILNDKRATNVLLVIKTDDGRTVRKMHTAKTLRIFDEVAEVVTKARGRKADSTDKDTPWDTMEAEIQAAAEHVGKIVTFIEFGTELKVTGRIVGIVPDKRVKRLLYRIDVEGRAVHKVSTASFEFEVDDKTDELRIKFLERREAASAREPQTLEQKVAATENAIAKTEEQIVKAQARLEDLRNKLAQLHAEATATLEAAEAAEAAEVPEAIEDVDLEDLA